MTDNEIKPGAIVWLKSGSPAMTVKMDNPPHGWLCNWFDGKTPQAMSYVAEQLTDTEPEKGSIGR